MDTSRVDGVKAPQHRGTPRSYHFTGLWDVLKSSWRRVGRKWRARLLNGTLASGCGSGSNCLANLDIFWFRRIKAFAWGRRPDASYLCDLIGRA